MPTVIECASCGHKNQVDTQAIKLARCGACKDKLVEADAVLDALSDEEIAAVVEDAPPGHANEEINTSTWLSRIGDYQDQEKYVDKGFWSKVKKYAGKVPFAREAVAMYYCAMDPGTPTAAKVTAIGALAYWILPIDVIPDFVPVAGFADDATAVFIAYKAVSSHITDVHREKAEKFFAG